MTGMTVALIFALIAAGFVLVGLTALFGAVRGPRQVHDADAENRRMRRDLERYEKRTRAELRRGQR